MNARSEREHAEGSGGHPDSSGRTERKRQRRARARRDILDAAERALGPEGNLGALTMEDIAAEAGYTPGALYGYFRNKNAIVLGLFRRLEGEMRAAITEADPPGLGFRELLGWRLDRLTSVARRHVGLFHAFFVLGMGPIAEEIEDLTEVHETLVASLARALDRGVAEGLVWDTDRRDLALALLGIHREFFVRWFYSGRGEPLEERSRRAVEIFLHGAGAGRRLESDDT